MNLRKDIVCLGEAMIELSSVERESCRLGVAGDTYNTAVYLARLGQRVHYATAIGDCAFSSRIISALSSENIGTDTVLRIPGRSVGIYAISLDNEGERSFTYWRSESAVRSLFACDGRENIIRALTEARTVYLSGISLSLFDEAQADTLFCILRARRDHDQVTVFDGNYRPRNWANAAAARRAIETATGLASLTLPTFDDEASLFGDKRPEETARRHLGLGARDVVVKHGKSGAFRPDTGWVAPPQIVRPLDTTGAGDSFNAGFIAARAEGKPVKDAILAAHDLAGRVLRTPGAILPR